MLKISKQADYAIKLLTALQNKPEGTLLSLKKFSEETTISFLFLQKIAKSLREAGLITAQKGVHGGYALEKSIEDITLAEVIEAVDGPLAVVKCLKAGEVCGQEKDCTTRPIFAKIQTDFLTIMSNTSIADFA